MSDANLAKNRVPSNYFPVVSFPNSTTTVSRCNMTRITFSGFFPYYRIFVLPTANAILVDLPNLSRTLDTLPLQGGQGGYFDWNVDPGIPIGMEISIAIRDGYGAWSFSESRTVAENTAGGNVTCPPNEYNWYQSTSSSSSTNASSADSPSPTTTTSHSRSGWHLFNLPSTGISVIVLLVLLAAIFLAIWMVYIVWNQYMNHRRRRGLLNSTGGPSDGGNAEFAMGGRGGGVGMREHHSNERETNLTAGSRESTERILEDPSRIHERT